MTTQIEIDPNVRLGGTRTFAGFEHVRGTDGVKLYVGEVVEVVEPESHLYGKGMVESIDVERRLVFLDVEWATLEVVESASSSEPEDRPRPTLTVISGGRADSLIDYGYPSEFVHVGVRHGGEQPRPLALAMG